MEKGTKRIGEIMVTKGYITQAQLTDALTEQRMTDKFLGTILLEKGWLKPHDLTEALAEQFNIPVIDLKAQYIDMEITNKFSSSLISEHKCFPVSINEETITVAILNPLDGEGISTIEEQARPHKVNFVIAFEDDFNEVMGSYRKFRSQRIQNLLRKDKPKP